MRPERVHPGRPIRSSFEGAVLARDLAVAGQRWPKGRRLSAADLARLASARPADAAALATDGVTVASHIHADAEFRAAVAAVQVRRALEAAIARAG